jgi:hypothetical protein
VKYPARYGRKKKEIPKDSKKTIIEAPVLTARRTPIGWSGA